MRVGSKNPSLGCPGPHGQESPDLQNVIAAWPLSPAVAEGLEDRQATASVEFSPCSPCFLLLAMASKRSWSL